MPVRQQKARCAVVKGRPQPTVELVATLTIAGGKRRSRRSVRRIRGALPVFQVARIAGRRKSQELPRRRLLVALLARHGGVRAKQWKAILVILHLLYRDIPALHRVALLAIRSHLPPVNVRVAIRAILPHVGEHRLYVALHTFHLFVHASQRIGGFIVVELGSGFDRTPSTRGVAVFARHIQRAVGTALGLVLGGTRGRRRQGSGGQGGGFGGIGEGK